MLVFDLYKKNNKEIIRQVCPTCKRYVKAYSRYPNYVCQRCIPYDNRQKRQSRDILQYQFFGTRMCRLIYRYWQRIYITFLLYQRGQMYCTGSIFGGHCNIALSRQKTCSEKKGKVKCSTVCNLRSVMPYAFFIVSLTIAFPSVG